MGNASNRTEGKYVSLTNNPRVPDLKITQKGPVVLSSLIQMECTRIGLDEQEFVCLLGIKKSHKTSAFAEQLKNNQMAKIIQFRYKLVDILNVTLEQVDEAIQASKNAYYAQVDAAWRASFQPHAVLITANKIPSPIFAAAITGSAQKLYIGAPANLSKLAWPSWFVKNLPDRLPGFGDVQGFVINYTPDRAIRFDLLGNPVETLDTALRRGSAWMKGIPPNTFRGHT